jgi:hypothetical protein
MIDNEFGEKLPNIKCRATFVGVNSKCCTHYTNFHDRIAKGSIISRGVVYFVDVMLARCDKDRRIGAPHGCVSGCLGPC